MRYRGYVIDVHTHDWSKTGRGVRYSATIDEYPFNHFTIPFSKTREEAVDHAKCWVDRELDEPQPRKARAETAESVEAPTAEAPAGTGATKAEAPVARTANETPSGIFLDSPEAVFQYLAPRLCKESQEVFIVLPLSTHSELMGEGVEVARGSRDEVSVDSADVIRVAAVTNCNAAIVVHNHPAMQAQPSDSDKDLTTSLEKALAAAFPGDKEGVAKVPLADHVIISAKQSRSGSVTGEWSSWRTGWKVHENVRVKAKR
jgi:proteasome lid subunit RPN8/RPN11